MIRVNRRTVIIDMEPITHIEPIAIDGQLRPLHRANDHEGDEFLGELKGSVIVGTTRDRNR